MPLLVSTSNDGQWDTVRATFYTPKDALLHIYLFKEEWCSVRLIFDTKWAGVEFQRH